MAPRSNPTQTEKRLDRIERAIAQLASAGIKTVAWRPEQNGQPELQAILDEQREIVEMERRPYSAPEQREAVSA